MQSYLGEEGGPRPPARRRRLGPTAGVAALVVALLAVLAPTADHSVSSVAVSGGDAKPQATRQPPSTAGRPGTAARPASAPTAASGRVGDDATPRDEAPAPAASETPATTATTAPAGTGSTAPAATDTPPPCGPGACLTLAGAANGAPFSPVANGLTDGSDGGSQDAAAMNALQVSNYRGAPTFGLLGLINWSQWDATAAHARTTTLILSNLWAEQYATPYPPTPWSDWSKYSNWVAGIARQVALEHQPVTYFDVYNEPGWSGYYSPQDYDSITPARLLQQFLVAYQAIKSADPSARIIGPSVGHWSLTPVAPNPVSREVDLGTFLRFAAAHHLQLAAVAWHDTGATPAEVVSDAAATEALIHQLPALGDPPMMLDEYAGEANQPIPGWDVAYLAAIGQAGFVSADRSCWDDDCYDASLDGLLGPGGVAETAEYWERLAYAGLHGTSVAVSSNDPDLAGVAASDSSDRRLGAVVGRDAGCAAAAWCASEFSPGAVPAPGEAVEVRVEVPWTDPLPTVRLSAIPFSTALQAAAPAVERLAGVSVTPAAGGGEWLAFSIPSWADGTAYVLTIT